MSSKVSVQQQKKHDHLHVYRRFGIGTWNCKNLSGDLRLHVEVWREKISNVMWLSIVSLAPHYPGNSGGSSGDLPGDLQNIVSPQTRDYAR